ncbi:MAG TPA: EpsI family protein [Candidatus Omnitrophota bacterium]|nr:EpsI family protein [Candidatus Omnitrophota bacterium]HRZ14100.1 EpsI family protein [Candidatus Omnitrophota bacterium]
MKKAAPARAAAPAAPFNPRYLIAAILICAAIAISFAIPKPKYQSLNVLKQISIPVNFGDWKGNDIGQQLDLNDDRYRFISDIFARTYTRADGAQLMLLILDAGNFHNPKVCFGSSGYKIRELPDTRINAGKRSFETTTLLMTKDPESTMLIYWLCIDKKITSWAGQKTKELWFSLFNKKKAGLMVRLDVPAHPQAPEASAALAQQFVTELSTHLSEKDLTLIFGAQ